MVPLLAVGQLVAVVLILAVRGVVPAVIVTLIVPVHPEASVKRIVCGPDATLVNTLLVCAEPPSSE